MAKPAAAQVSRDRSFAWGVQFRHFLGLKIRQRSFAGDNQSSPVSVSGVAVFPEPCLGATIGNLRGNAIAALDY